MTFSTSILKAIMLSTVVFWLVIISEEFNTDMILIAFISIVPISICCSLTIAITIIPFFTFNKKMNCIEVYKKYFPFYAMVSFSLCFYGVWDTNFNLFPVSFFLSAFFTTLQTWNWIVKDNMPLKNN